jgi:hypothetical protein
MAYDAPLILTERLRRIVCKRGEWLDEWRLAITRPDWEAL